MCRWGMWVGVMAAGTEVSEPIEVILGALVDAGISMSRRPPTVTTPCRPCTTPHCWTS